MNERKLLLVSFVALMMIVAVGIAGYMMIDGLSFVNALYLVTVIFSTVGLGGGEQLSTSGKVFTIFLVTTGVAVGTYVIGTFTRVIVEVQIRKVFGKGFSDKVIKKLKNHYIICGGGESTDLIIREFEQSRSPFVVIENDDAIIDDYAKRSILYFKGDPIKDESLIDAGIERAKGLISNLPTDVGNVFVVLSARNLNPDLTIVTRSENENSLEKLKKAGANKVIAPNIIGGRRMAAAMLKPTVVDFLDMAMHGQDLDLQMEEIEVTAGGEMSGHTLIDSRIRQKSGVIVVAIRKSNRLITNPAPNTVLENNDRLIVLGSASQIELLRKM